MEVDLRDAQRLRQRDPRVHLVLGEVAEVEQVRPVVVLSVQRPGPADGRVRQLRRRRHGFLHYLAQFCLRTTDQRHLRAGKPEPRIAGRRQPARRLRNAVHLRLQVERQRTGGERLCQSALQRQTDVDEGELADRLIADRHDLHDEVALRRRHLQHRRHSGRAELQRQSPVGERGLRRRVLLAGFGHPRERGLPRFRAVVRPGLPVGELQVLSVGAHRERRVVVLDNQGGLRLGERRLCEVEPGAEYGQSNCPAGSHVWSTSFVGPGGTAFRPEGSSDGRRRQAAAASNLNSPCHTRSDSTSRLRISSISAVNGAGRSWKKTEPRASWPPSGSIAAVGM